MSGDSMFSNLTGWLTGLPTLCNYKLHFLSANVCDEDPEVQVHDELEAVYALSSSPKMDRPNLESRT